MKSSRGVARRGGSGSRSSCRASTPARKLPGRPTPFEPGRRITRGAELRTIARTGKRLRTEHLDVRVVASLSHLPHARVGLVVPKHGRSAVQRNTLKRRLRELSRTVLLPDIPAVDFVIHTRPSAYTVEFAELSALVEKLRSQIQRVAPALLADTFPDPGPASRPRVM